MRLGELLLSKDQNTTWNLFDDFAFSKLLNYVKLYPLKRKHLLGIIYSYCSPEVSVHINVIKSLQVLFYYLSNHYNRKKLLMKNYFFIV